MIDRSVWKSIASVWKTEAGTDEIRAALRSRDVRAEKKNTAVPLTEERIRQLRAAFAFGSEDGDTED